MPNYPFPSACCACRICMSCQASYTLTASCATSRIEKTAEQFCGLDYTLTIDSDWSCADGSHNATVPRINDCLAEGDLCEAEAEVTCTSSDGAVYPSQLTYRLHLKIKGVGDGDTPGTVKLTVTLTEYWAQNNLDYPSGPANGDGSSAWRQYQWTDVDVTRDVCDALRLNLALADAAMTEGHEGWPQPEDYKICQVDGPLIVAGDP